MLGLYFRQSLEDQEKERICHLQSTMKLNHLRELAENCINGRGIHRWTNWHNESQLTLLVIKVKRRFLFTPQWPTHPCSLQQCLNPLSFSHKAQMMEVLTSVSRQALPSLPRSQASLLPPNRILQIVFMQGHRSTVLTQGHASFEGNQYIIMCSVCAAWPRARLIGN